MDIEHVLVTNAAGVWFPVRFTSTKAGRAAHFQLLGEKTDKGPTAFVRYFSQWENAIDWDTFHVDVEGVKLKVLA